MMDLKLAPCTFTGWESRADYREEFADIEAKIEDCEHFLNHCTCDEYIFPDEADKVHGYTVTEVVGVHDIWKKNLKKIDTLFTCSEFCKERFEPYTDKVVVAPHGVEEKFEPGEGTMFEDYEFVFLSVFQWIWRKGWDKLIKAYLSEFTEDQNTALVLRTYIDRKHEQYPRRDVEMIYKDITRIQQDYDNHPKIILVYDWLPSIVDLYNSADCFVLPSRGEGFGLPYLEAMACGVPTIGTGWGGNLDFMNENNSLLIDVPNLEHCNNMEHIPWYDPEFYWADPSLHDLKDKMKWVYENQDEAQALGEQAAKDAQKWTWKRGAEKIIEGIN